MSADKAFLDTNVFVYLYSEINTVKHQHLLKVINIYDRVVSTQVLNEFCSVCIRKMNLPLQDIKAAIEEICETCELLKISDVTVMNALDLHERYRYSYYDSLMIASALEYDCSYLLTEDMADGQVIEGRLTIRNIFVKE
jgi:predicted nucleic acid-binding protein